MEVKITFPICPEEFFFETPDLFQKIKKKIPLPGFEMIHIQKSQNNMEIKIPCFIEGIHSKKQSYFIFLLPKKIFGDVDGPNKTRFFKKGLCRIEGASSFNNCTVLVFNGKYQKENTSLVGKIDYYEPPHFGWM